MSWGTVGWILSLLFAGFIAWSNMAERVKLIEARLDSLATRQEIHAIRDLLCEDPEKARRRACQDRAG
jgi:hypothetical protein